MDAVARRAAVERRPAGAARDLLRAALARAERDPEIEWLSERQRWAFDVCLDAGLELRVAPTLDPIVPAWVTWDWYRDGDGHTGPWPQDPEGLELAQARGTIALQVDKGVLNAVKPGAGRVLGLLNL